MLGFGKNKTSASAEQTEKPGLFKRLRDGLSRTRHGLSDGLTDLLPSTCRSLLCSCQEALRIVQQAEGSSRCQGMRSLRKQLRLPVSFRFNLN